MTGAVKAGTAAAKVAALADLSREDLAKRWFAIYGRPPPPGVRRELLLHAAAWATQAKAMGGLSPDTRKLLKRAVARVERVGAAHSSVAHTSSMVPTAAADANTTTLSSLSSPIPTERRTVRSGARLLRDWNGQTHVVDVVDNGFLFEGRTHRSLSAIAKQITGAHWSGPRFFGL